jgi:PAS domain S-box-containing protein
MRAPSIRSRLKAIIMAVTAASLTLACAAFLAYDAIAARGAARTQLEGIAQIVANQSSAALTFNDPKTATEILAALKAEDQILEAVILDAAGARFARYLRGPGDARLEVVADVQADRDRLGTVIVRSDLSGVNASLLRNALIALAVLAGASLAGFLLSTRLERLVTGPILHLAETVRRVAGSRDYSVRARKRTDDETGLLIDGFNDMLAQIQARDAALLQARDQLEARIKARTAELSHANSALSIAEARYRQIVESVQAIVWRADARTFAFTFVSPEAVKVLGYPTDRWLESPAFWPDHLHPDDRLVAVETCKAATRRGLAHEMDYRMIAADGRVVWLRDLISVVMEGGEPVELIGVMIDITAQKAAELALRESEERYRQLFHGSPDAILVEIEERLVLMNPAAEEILGMIDPGDGSCDSILSRVARHPAGRPRPGESVRYDDSWKHADGRVVEVEVTVSAFRHGGRRGSQIVARDITQRKAMDRLKNEFISTVSHELRTPLTSIRGSLGLVASGKAGVLPAAARKFIEIANTDSQRLIRLINDLLDIQKIEAGRMEFRLGPADLSEIVRRAVEANRGYGDQFGVRFVLDRIPPATPITGDPDRLLQVMANLLSNAAKFSPRGSPVELGIERAGGTVRAWVRDHGPGIPAEFQNRIFQKFAQADSSDTRQQAGTGLGLSICRAIVERHGGSIDFVTGPAGTTFRFELPDVVPAEPASRS